MAVAHRERQRKVCLGKVNIVELMVSQCLQSEQMSSKVDQLITLLDLEDGCQGLQSGRCIVRRKALALEAQLTPRPASPFHLNLLALPYPWLIYASCICSKSQLTVDFRHVFNFHAIPPNSMRRPVVSSGNRGLRLLYVKPTIRG
ncbi:unnamed protein product [Mesocestoides corti]|uniref:Uncharacterized protein n=2 Tax=Mesocestoides corti TaxID=53468 RepID=A0A0R3UFF3_MESCO|nr:unnamed protein product [Mesocestoides corti]